MSRNRVVVLGLLAVTVVLAWALPASAKPSKANVTTVTVTEGKPTEFKITLSAKTVKSGIVIFKVTNKGALPHDFSISGRKTPLLSPGRSNTLRVTLKKGKATYMCTVTGHAAAGMKGVLVVS